MKTLWIGVLVAAACTSSEPPPDAHVAETVQSVSSIGAVLTQHNDIARTGLNPNESILETSAVGSNFGKITELPTGGYVYAQPLFVPDVVVGGVTHNVVYVADEKDTVYAYDPNSGAVLWQRTLGTPATANDLFYTNLDPVNGGFIGITGTPVIDPATSTLYVIALSKVAQGVFTQTIYALDLANGTIKHQQVIVAGSHGILFDPMREHQRTGLLLWGNHVYAGWGGFNADSIDFDPNNPNASRTWHGWVMGFDSTSLAVSYAWVSVAEPSPCCVTDALYGGGIWMAGSGLAADANYIYVGVGEGNNNGSNNWGESVVALNSSLADPTNWFAPAPLNGTLEHDDEDMTGVMVLPETNVGGHASTLVTGDKFGDLYVLDRGSLGGVGGSVSTLPHAVGLDPATMGERENFLGLPAHFNGKLYYTGYKDVMKVFTVGPSGLAATSLASTDVYGYMSVPSVSSWGNAGGIVWAIQRTPANFYSLASGVLNAYDAITMTKLYSSATESDNPVGTVQFTPPTVAGGKVFLAGKNVSEYGTLLTPSTPLVQVTGTDSFTLGTSPRYHATTYALTATTLLGGAGLTVTFAPATLTAGQVSTVTVTAAPGTLPGNKVVQLTATESGHPTWIHSTRVVVHVN
ncbi:MAG TPA: PQQ-binding-like beta-propeller repeat protein [Kofleriaceae bacterium]|jgi:hypothetical protein